MTSVAMPYVMPIDTPMIKHAIMFFIKPIVGFILIFEIKLPAVISIIKKNTITTELYCNPKKSKELKKETIIPVSNVTKINLLNSDFFCCHA